MIPVIWYISSGFWDSTLPRYILDLAGACAHGTLTKEGLSYQIPPKQYSRVGVIVVPGQHSTDAYELLNATATIFDRVVWIITGDEEGIFHSDELKHPRQKIWWFVPPFNPKQKIDFVAPFGWTGEFTKITNQVLSRRTLSPFDMRFGMAETPLPRRMMRDIDWSFVGQITHSRRVECVDAIQHVSQKGFLHLTDGFARTEPKDGGMPREEYAQIMLRSKMVLCPSGPCTPDTFRFAEALECGCIPIVDNRTQNPTYPTGYWDYIFGEHKPFPVVNEWSELPAVMEEWLQDWELKADRCARFWDRYKWGLVERMRKDLHE